jgi:hypothetical protein
MKFLITTVVFILCINLISPIYSQNEEKIILNDIAGNINNYKNKTITLKLKLKILDTTFDKLVFYDRKNIDIIFDITELKKNKAFQKQALNLHQGLEYHVVFTVRELTDKNNIIGDLKSFSPVIFSRLPD